MKALAAADSLCPPTLRRLPLEAWLPALRPDASAAVETLPCLARADPSVGTCAGADDACNARPLPFAMLTAMFDNMGA